MTLPSGRVATAVRGAVPLGRFYAGARARSFASVTCLLRSAGSLRDPSGTAPRSGACVEAAVPCLLGYPRRGSRTRGPPARPGLIGCRGPIPAPALGHHGPLSAPLPASLDHGEMISTRRGWRRAVISPRCRARLHVRPCRAFSLSDRSSTPVARSWPTALTPLGAVGQDRDRRWRCAFHHHPPAARPVRASVARRPPCGSAGAEACASGARAQPRPASGPLGPTAGRRAKGVAPSAPLARARVTRTGAGEQKGAQQ